MKQTLSNRRRRRICLALAILLSILISGCGKQTEEQTAVPLEELDLNNLAIPELKVPDVSSSGDSSGEGSTQPTAGEEASSGETTGTEGTAESETEETLAAESADSGAGDAGAESFRNPLTGLDSDTDLSRTRAYAYLCNNICVAMPLSGLADADMVWELMGEGGVTQLMLLMSDPSAIDRIGPITAARTYQVELALGYDAFLVHSGASEEAEAMIQAYGLADVEETSGAYGAGTFFRDSTRQEHGAEYGLYSAGEGCADSVQDLLNYRTDHRADYDETYGLMFSEQAGQDYSDSADYICITYAGGKTSSFYYEEETGLYAFAQYGQRMEDADGQKVAFSNVIMLSADTWMNPEGTHLDIELTSGEGWAFTGGKVENIWWQKDGVYDVFHFTREDGTTLTLTPGRTFLGINQQGGFEGSLYYE